ncbi:HD domain-containing protein, partial [bacterium]
VQERQVEELRQLTYGIAVDNQEEAVEILDARGALLFSMHHVSGGGIEEYEFSKEGDRALLEWEFIQKVVGQQSDGYSNKYSGLVQAGWGDYFYIAGPILDPAGAQVGTLLVGKSLAKIGQEMRAETLAQVTLYDFAGRPLTSTFSQPVSLPQPLVSQAVAGQDESSLTRNLRALQVANIEYQEILGPWEARDDSDIGLLGISLPRNFYVSPTRITRLQVILLLCAAILLVIALGINLARIITRPLINLVRASTQISRGNFQIHLQPDSNDEVAVLTETFNEMVGDLQTSRNALLHAYDRTLEGWSKALELRDKETEGHTVRVTKMAVELARQLGIRDEDLVQIQRGALLHDIGKMGVPDEILLKPGKLSDEEWVIMRKHPQFAYELLAPIEYLQPALDIPYAHHERWDGKGYPCGLQAAQIPIAARIFAVIDVWDALRSERPYKRALSFAESYAIIQSESGSHFDPHVVQVFLADVVRLYEAEFSPG